MSCSIYWWHEVRFDAIKIGMGVKPKERMFHYANAYGLRFNRESLKFYRLPSKPIAAHVEKALQSKMVSFGCRHERRSGLHDASAEPTELFMLNGASYDAVSEHMLTLIDEVLLELAQHMPKQDDERIAKLEARNGELAQRLEAKSAELEAKAYDLTHKSAELAECQMKVLRALAEAQKKGEELAAQKQQFEQIWAAEHELRGKAEEQLDAYRRNPRAARAKEARARKYTERAKPAKPAEPTRHAMQEWAAVKGLIVVVLMIILMGIIGAASGSKPSSSTTSNVGTPVHTVTQRGIKEWEQREAEKHFTKPAPVVPPNQLWEGVDEAAKQLMLERLYASEVWQNSKGLEDFHTWQGKKEAEASRPKTGGLWEGVDESAKQAMQERLRASEGWQRSKDP
ncbi:hypothetical protein SAMN02990966_05693 [Rhodospirillales bacterium URHD0017]|nr:hypothetical protein SAMN02990966_05693 [Rhodospirillales bacterium URHD0017]